MTENDHETSVDQWLEAQAKGLTTAQLIPLFERALAAVWQRSHRTLGDVTVKAIMDRVLHTARDPHPLLSSLRLEASGIRGDDLGGRAGSPEELRDGMRFLLVEFLTVLGHLTADILTPALHADLKAVTARSEGVKTRRAANPRRRSREHKA